MKGASARARPSRSRSMRTDQHIVGSRQFGENRKHPQPNRDTYMGNFVPHLSHHTEPLRAMLKQEAVFAWDEMANASFQKIKDLIAKSATKPLRYYDRRKPVTVQVDASQRGLGACLLQDGQPIAYASKSLTDTETRYANIERELLAIVFPCQRFNTYVLGRPFTVESDHKPLEMIHQKSLVSAPPDSSECSCSYSDTM